MTDPAAQADPVLVEIVAGTLAAVEAEVETAIGRTARSPMIRDAHDFRAGIHDVRIRKLTGRSYSALVQPVVRDYPIDTMRNGDVFFHNDVYLSEGGIGHLPDLCVTVPVFHAGEVVAFVQAFGHHDDIGGAVPGSMPSRATSVFEEGLMVPPIRLWDAGVPNEAALKIMTRNSRMPESLAADLDSECAACLLGARRLAELFDRYGRGRVEAAFEEILRATTETYRTEILSVIPDGSYVWEDYAEHDGVDEPRLHTQRITLTKASAGDGITDARIVLDFTGTAPQAKGPINHCADYADGVFLAKWLAPILRNLAATPGADGAARRQRGGRAVDRDAVPTQGNAAHADLSRRRPTPARSSSCGLLGVLAGVLAKAVDGRMPADQETIRYTGVYGTDETAEPFLMREVLGGGSGGRYYADGEDTIHVVPDSRNLPTEFSESRFPFLRRESRRWPSIPAAPAGIAAASATTSRSGCSPTASSCRSPTARSCRAGACAAAGPAGLPRDDRPGRAGRAGGGRDGRRGARPRRRGGQDPHHGRRRLGRPAEPPGSSRYCGTCGTARFPRRRSRGLRRRRHPGLTAGRSTSRRPPPPRG